MDSNFYKNLLDNLYDGIYFVNRDRKIMYWNKSAERLTGYKSCEVVGTYCWENDLIHVSDKGISLCKEFCPVVKAITNGHLHEVEVYLHHKDGQRVPVLIRVIPIRDSNGEIVGAAEILSDNSSKVAIFQGIGELQKLALLDPLTEAGNRRYAEINLNARLEEMCRYGWPFGVLFIDIDHFKTINDVCGHDIGDRVLKMVAKTLLNSVRSFDVLSRWGGEEFIAIIVNVDEDQLYSIANKLRILVEQSRLYVDSKIIKVTISIGATLARPGDTVDTLLKRADQLMYHSKTSGRNCISMGLDKKL